MLDLPLFTGRLAYFAQRLIACFSHYAYNDYGRRHPAAVAKIARREAGGAVEQFPGTVCNRL
jgi:hypothetical protein